MSLTVGDIVKVVDGFPEGCAAWVLHPHLRLGELSVVTAISSTGEFVGLHRDKNPHVGHWSPSRFTKVGPIEVGEDPLDPNYSDGPEFEGWQERCGEESFAWCNDCETTVAEPCTEKCDHPANRPTQPYSEPTPLERGAALEPMVEHDGKADQSFSPVFQGLFDYFPRAVLAIAELSKHGAEKYEWKGWEKVPDAENRYRNALGRHILKKAIEGDYDADWAERGHSVLHDTAVAWNACAVLEQVLRRLEGADAS